MAWLTNWAKRIELTIDSTKVDSVLPNFPVLVKISNSSGITTTDVTSVFTELGSDSNRKKIAVTTDNGTTQCYVEIERFDYANSVAWLWIKIPSIASGASTIFYLYYDSGQADNTTYVGDTTDTPAQSVWDSNFVGVWHMSQNPAGGASAMKDSTSNTNHGTSAGSMTSGDLVDGKIGKGIDFDGSNDYIYFPNMAGSFSTEASLELILKLDTNIPSDPQTGFGIFGTSGDMSHYPFTNGSIYLETFRNDRLTLGSVGINRANWHTLSITNEPGASNWKFYQNTTQYYSTTGETTVGFPTNANIGQSGGGKNLDGIVCELRLSNTIRSAAWIKATYYSNWDTLITYGTEEMNIVFTFSNPIPVDLSTVYGITQQLYLTTTISGPDPSYIYDAVFYDAYDDSQISSTVYGTQSGQQAGVIMSTPSGINYQWYMTATSSGTYDTSNTYTFSNRFLYDGYVTQEAVPVNRVVRLYHRDTGELMDSTTSSGAGGYYYLGTTISGEHFIVAFDDDLGNNYNALILDKLLPEV